MAKILHDVFVKRNKIIFPRREDSYSATAISGVLLFVFIVASAFYPGPQLVDVVIRMDALAHAVGEPGFGCLLVTEASARERPMKVGSRDCFLDSAITPTQEEVTVGIGVGFSDDLKASIYLAGLNNESRFSWHEEIETRMICGIKQNA